MVEVHEYLTIIRFYAPSLPAGVGRLHMLSAAFPRNHVLAVISFPNMNNGFPPPSSIPRRGGTGSLSSPHFLPWGARLSLV